jgi:hypothetical protein
VGSVEHIGMNLFQLATDGIDLDTLPSGSQSEVPHTPIAFDAPRQSGAVSVPQEFEDVFNAAAQEYDVDADVLKGIAYAESRFNPDIVSGKVKSPVGAIGLMQFMPETASKEFGIDPTDPVQSIFGAAAYMRKSLDKFDGDYEKAVASYNWGRNRSTFNESDWTSKLPKETSDYLGRVFEAAGQLKDLRPTDPIPADEPKPTPKNPSEVLQEKAEPVPERSWGDVAGDAAVMTAKSVIGLPQALAGLADLAQVATPTYWAEAVRKSVQAGEIQMPKTGQLSKALESVGFRPDDAQKYLDSLYSDTTKANKDYVSKGEGFVDTAKRAIERPSTIGLGVGESAAQMLGGGSLARGLTTVAPKVAPWLAGAVGEGGVGAGSAAQQLREQSKDGLNDGRSTLSALGSGVGTAVFGVAGGKLSNSKLGQRLGISDVDTLLAGGATTKSPAGFVKQVLGSGFSEGFLQELPQSVQEQMWQNYATDKPLMEGVENAAAMGALTGKAMGMAGGGYNALASRGQAPSVPTVENQPTTPQTPIVQRQEQAITPQAPTVPDSAVETAGANSAGNIASAILDAERSAEPARAEVVAPTAPTESASLEQALQDAPATVSQLQEDNIAATEVLVDAPSPVQAVASAVNQAPESALVNASPAVEESVLANSADSAEALDLIDVTGKPAASWVVVDKETGKPQVELQLRSMAEKVNTAKYKAIPAGKYLADLNKRIKTGATPDWALSSGANAAGSKADEAGVVAESGRAESQVANAVLQNRNRATPASIAQMQSIAKAPDYGRLGFSRDFANGAPVVAGSTYRIPNTNRGRKDVAIASDGTRIPVQYAVVDASGISASNAADGTINADYNNTEKKAIRAIAGNGRVAGLQAAYVNDTAQQYASDLAADMDLHGIPASAIQGMQQPVLVRVMPNSSVTANIGDLSNTQNNLQLSAVEQARNDSARIDLDALNFAEDGSVTPETIRQFVRSMPQSEQGGLIDTNGQPSRQAADRIQAAVFAKAYGNDGLIRLFAQAQDPEARLIMSALARVAPKMARLEGAGALDIRGIVAQAAEIAVNARREGKPLALAAKQMDMASEPDVGLILDLFAKYPRSNAPVIDALSAAADFAYEESNKPDYDMFGPVERASRADILDKLKGQNERTSPQNLEDSTRSEPARGNAIRQSADSAASGDANAIEASGPTEAGAAEKLNDGDIRYSRNDDQSSDLLEAYTASDVVARQEADADAQRQSKAKQAAQDAQYRKEQDRKEIAAKSVAAADTFELGGDAMDNLSGQDGFQFSKKAKAETDEKNLIIQHNLTAENLLHAAKMGGIAVPSLAVTTKNEPLTGFGEITLIGSVSMADPKGYAGTKVFGADIYSPRYPGITLEFTPNMRKRGEAMIRDGMDATDTKYIEWGEVERDGARELKRQPAVMWSVLQEAGIEPTITRMQIGPLAAEIMPFAKDTRHAHELASDPDFSDAAYAAHRAMLVEAYGGDAEATANADKEIAKLQEPDAQRASSQLVSGYASDVQRYQRDLRESGRVDKWATTRAMEDQIRDAGLDDKLMAYAANMVAELTPNERIFQGLTNSGRRKYIPHTLENVVKILKKELRGGENFNYGVGSLRAKFTPQFKTVAEIRKAKDRLISSDDFGKIKDEINTEFLDMADAMSIRSETLSAIMEDAVKMGVTRAAAQYGVDMGGNKAAEVAEFITKLRELPTEYFEAKILRDVDLAEFSAAVVPSDVSQKIKDALASRGVTHVFAYERNNEADRKRAIQEAAASKDDLLFSQGDQAPRTAIYTITQAITKAYGNILSRLEAKGLVSIVQTEGDAFDAAAQARADKTGGDVDAIKQAIGKSVAMQSVWHGTPHRGIEKFSADNIGTGEGAQAYGWGLYFASKKEVADWYRSTLSRGMRGWNYPQEARSLGIENYEEFRREFHVHADGDAPVGIAAKRIGDASVAARSVDGLALSRLVEAFRRDKQGQLYEVEIPEDGEMLLWDKPMSEQPQAVQDALAASFFAGTSTAGEQVYRRIGSMLNKGTQDKQFRATSKYLAGLGIKGIKYLDGQSRYKPLRDVRLEFLAELPEDAEFDEVMALIGTGKFSAKNEAVIKALADDEWLGFDYPAQALSSALSSQLQNFDPSQELLQAVAATQDGSTYNYVIFDGADTQILDIHYSADGGIQGFFDKATGKSFLIADNLTAESAPGTLMHEVGIHMAADGKLEPIFKRALSLLKAGKNNPFIKRVQSRMDSAGETSGEEAAAYIVTEYETNRVNAPASIDQWVKDLIASVRAWLFSKGVLLKADRLTVADIAAVARANAKSLAAYGMQTNETTGGKEDQAFSRDDWYSPDGLQDGVQEASISKALKLEIVAEYNTRSGRPIPGDAFYAIDEASDIAAKSHAFALLAKSQGFTVYGAGDKYMRIAKSTGEDSEISLNVRVSDHSNVNRGRHYKESDINLAPNDGYLRDTFESALWKMQNASVDSYGDTLINGDEPIRFSKTSTDQTETEAFKKWFGDSKVVDADGRPLVVYHGTASDFSEFAQKQATDKEGRRLSMGWGSKKFYFARSANAASSAAEWAAASKDRPGDTANVMPVYLRIEKPISAMEYTRQIEELTNGGASRDAAIKTIDKRLMADGYDGIIDAESGGIAVFRAEQIKSAIGNNGDFDPSNPDIRFSRNAKPTSQPNAITWDDLGDSRMDKFLYEMQDDRIDLRRVQENIEKQGREIREEFDARQAETLFPGRVARRGEDFLDAEVKPLLRDMSKNNVSMELLSDYLLARHAPERNAQIAKVNPDMPDGGAGSNSQGVLMTTKAAEDYIANLSAGQRTMLGLLANRVDAITKGTRDILVGEGLEKAETVAAWSGAYKHYVPLFKDESAETPGHPIGSGFSVKGGASKRAMGSDKAVTNMLAHVMMQREAAITRAEKNRVAMSLYGLALANPNNDFWTTVRPNMEQADIARQFEAMGIDPVDAEAGMQSAPTIQTIDKASGLVVSRPNPMYKNMANAITLKVDGEDRVILFNTKNDRAMRMASSLKNAHFGSGVLNDATNVIGIGTRFIASMLTKYNPAFGMVNAVRDIQGALFNLSSTQIAGKQAAVLADVPAAVIGISRDIRGDKKRTKWSELWLQFQDDGGRTGIRDMVADPYEGTAKIEKELIALSKEGKLTVRNAVHATLDALGDFNDALENGVRLSAYKAALDGGMSRAASARLARELTVDFNRRGRTGRELGKLYAFLNAAIQGNARTIAALKGPKGKAIIAGGFAIGVMQAVMLAAAGFDDDDVPEFIKTRNLIIPQGGKRYIAIPMPLGLHVLPNSSRILTELMMSGGKDVGTKVVSAMAEMVNAFNPFGGGGDWDSMHGPLTLIAPTTLDPLLDFGLNRDFTGRTISKERRAGGEDIRPGSAMARESTRKSPSGQVFMELSDLINAASGGNDYSKGAVSPTPEELRYIVTTIGGGVYRETEKALNAATLLAKGEEIKPHQVPLGSRFSGEADREMSTIGRYYKVDSKLSELWAKINAAAKNGDGEKVDKLKADPMFGAAAMNNSVSQTLAKINKLAIENVGDKEKYRALQAKRVELMEKVNQAVKDAEAQADKLNQ